jgi:hypothetical protein
MRRGPAAGTGATELPIVFRLATATWLVMALQETALFFRPTPYGGAYVHEPVRYLGLALFYNLLSPGLIALPFVLRWWIAGRGAVSGASAVRWHRALLALLVLATGLDQADNEVMRFLGTHLTVNLLRTYERIGAWGSDMLHVFTTDRGGPGLPFLLLLLGMAGLWWWGGRIIRQRVAARWPVARTLLAALLPVALPALMYNLPGGHFPRNRVRPELVTLLIEARHGAEGARRPADYPRLVAEMQATWRAGTADSAWRFTDSAYPLWRAPDAGASRADAGAAGPPWNIIYLQVESLRGWNAGFLNPEQRPSATPFLDSLAADSASAVWTRHLSFGPPTINGFIAGHCSAPPHGERNISTVFTTTALQCFPAVLRHHGYHTVYLTGSDPDWDNQTVWLKRWYDETDYYHDADELDRVVFRRAAERIRRLGRSGRPFLATVVSISNHYPFRSREPALDLGPPATPAAAVRNTIHYTDDVLREFVRTLAAEPWFAHTVLVIVGDHGYNLGEHDGTPGQRNAWRESVWVPLLIHGAHPRLRTGRHDELASLLDVAPTITDLAGIRAPEAWLGRSLLAPPGPGGMVSMVRGDAVMAETPRWSMVLDPQDGVARLYDPLHDPLQRHDLAPEFPDTAARLLAEARERQSLWDYLVESNRVVPRRPAGMP